MADLWKLRQQKLAQRQQPKAPSVPPAAGLVEPPAQIPAVPVAPVVAPVAAPVSAPAPVAAAPAKVPKPPSLLPLHVPAAPATPVSKPPSVPPAPAPASPWARPAPAAPVAEPAETSSGGIEVKSGEVEIISVEPIPGPAPGPAAAELPSLAALLPDEAAPEPVILPSVAVPFVKPKAPAAELKRKESGTLGFKQLSDNGFLPSRYKLTYTGQAGADACNFMLIGKDTRQLTLELNVPTTVSVQTKGGPMSVTLTYKGASKTDGAKEVEYVVEGGVSAVTGIFEKFRRVGPVALSAFRSLVKHLPETIAIGFAAGLAVCGFTMDWVAVQLGRFHPYVTAAVPVLMAGMAIWTWAERSKNIRKESEKAE